MTSASPHPPERFGPDLPVIPVTAPTGTFSVQPLVPALRTGWIGPAVGEWELDDTTIIDQHPYDELNYVLEGELRVRAAGATVTAGPGEVIRVGAGTAAEYAAVGRARMVFVYGENPRGLPSEVLDALDRCGGGDPGHERPDR